MAHRLSIRKLTGNLLSALLILTVGNCAAMAGDLTLSRSQIYSVLDLSQPVQTMTLPSQTPQHAVVKSAMGGALPPISSTPATRASVSQNGTSNVASADQTTGDVLNISQIGNQNVATVRQGGWTGAVVRQTGNDNAAQLQLFHAGGHLELTQTGKQKVVVNQY